MFDFDDLIDSFEDDEFDERPVDIEEFVSSGYLELDRNGSFELSDYQRDIIKYSTQIYNLDTLIRLYGEEKGKAEYKYTKREIINMLGKGSGKDYMAEISCAYVVYKLLCLKDPASYFGLGPDSAIDIINIAVNADQANRVFFKGFKKMVEKSPWFADKAHATRGSVEFTKSVTVYSGHSEMESFEGYNAFMVVLDEISAFSGKNMEADVDPAQAIYDMFEASVTSRFPNHGKLLLLSFPRHSKDFITKRYNKVIAEKNSIVRTHTFILNEDISPDAPGNQKTIEWTEDHIIRYVEDMVWALRRPSWDVNPTKTIDDYKRSFLRNMRDALTRFAAEPLDGADGFFENHNAIEAFSTLRNAVKEDGVFERWFKPQEDTEYFIHVDLARKHDRAVVSMAHVTQWRREDFGGGDSDVLPYVRVDLMRYWEPTTQQQINFTDIRNFIMTLARMGFDIQRVTFDQWQSDDMINYLNKAGLRAERLAVGLQHYNDLKLMMEEGRALAPENEVLVTELKQLELTKNGKNVDHPRSGSKDMADSVCGAIYNAATLTSPPDDLDALDVITADDFIKQDEVPRKPVAFGTQQAPRGTKMPEDLEMFIALTSGSKK